MSYYESSSRPQALWHRWPAIRRWLPLIAIAVGVGLLALAWFLRGFILSLKAGYLAVILLSFVGSASLLLPVPALITVCATSTFLLPFVIGTLSGIGETAGEITGYALGFGGGTVLEKNRYFPRLSKWMETKGTLVIFLVSIIPNPVFDVVGIAAGGLRYPLKKFLAVVFVGKLIKGLLLAYTCYYGVSHLPWVNI